MVSSGASTSTSSRPKKTGVKGKKKSGSKTDKAKKAVKTGLGKKKKTSSTSNLTPAAPRPPPPVAYPYGGGPTHTPQPSQTVFYSEKKQYGKKRNSSVCALSFLVVFAWLAVIALGGFVIAGSVSTNAGADSIYLAELNSTGDSDITLRVGYFGGCASISSSDEQSSNNNSSSRTACTMNMRNKDIEDLAESFAEDLSEDFSLGITTQPQIQSTLNDTLLPLAKNMQSNIFFWPPPLLHLIFFVISGIMLFVIRVAGSSQKRAYKGMVVSTIVLCALTLALALVSVLGALSGLNALLNGDADKDEQDLGDGLFIHRGGRMHAMQAAVVAIAGLFYVLMGALFVLRTPEAAVGTILQVFQTASKPLKGMKRKC